MKLSTPRFKALTILSMAVIAFCTLSAEYDLNWYGDPVPRPAQGFPFPYIKAGSWSSLSFEVALHWLLIDFLVYLGLAYLLLRRLAEWIKGCSFITVPLISIAYLLVAFNVLFLIFLDVRFTTFDYQVEWQTIRFNFTGLY